MTAFDDLMAFQRETEALAQIAGRLAWDQETVMPRGAATQRGEETGALEGVLHARRTDPRIGEWLAAAKAPDAAGQRALDLVGRAYGRNACIPARLAQDIARLTSVAQGIWAQARAAEDVGAFLPTLAEVIARKREAAEALVAGGYGATAYDALLDDYEPGATAAELAAMFDRMRPRLVALREAVLGAEHQPEPLEGIFPKAAQLRLAHDLAVAFGYDFTRGRIDEAVHPFSSGSGNDVRVTTRVSETDPFNCIYSTIHEVGHAAYEQAISPDYLLTPLGAGASMGVHESQSRIYENQLGRSRAFAGWLFDRMARAFDNPGLSDPDALYGAINRVRPGFVRTEADEVHYNLHIMMRFDLERALIAGDLTVNDLEAAWNDRFQSDFGVAVDRPSHGMLQDVHWSVGLFGYFPTYTLGNVYAGCLYQAMQGQVAGLEEGLAAGNAGAATDWLRDRLQQHGGLYRPTEAITRACGFAPHEGPLLDYLETKFRSLYRL